MLASVPSFMSGYWRTGRSLLSSGLQVPPVQLLLAMSLPWQYLPPLAGVGLEQVLLLVVRQSVEQEDQADHWLQSPLTAGQTLVQDFFWMAGPSQPGPPLMLTGGGESQVLCLTWTPRPHSTLHWDQAAQSPQLPGSAIQVELVIKTIYNFLSSETCEKNLSLTQLLS